MIEAKIHGRPLGGYIVSDMRKHHVEAFVDANPVERIVTIVDANGKTYQTERGGVVSTNRCFGRLKAFFNWAIEREYLTENPALGSERAAPFESDDEGTAHPVPAAIAGTPGHARTTSVRSRRR
jgi:hypothetical protein